MQVQDAMAGRLLSVSFAPSVKKLSVNYADIGRHLAKRNDRRCKVVEGSEAAPQFLVAHEYLSEAIAASMADLDDPTSGLLLRLAPLALRLLPTGYELRATT